MTITFTAPPTLPSLSDPANFNDRALGLFGWLTGTFIPELEGVEGLIPDGGDFAVDGNTLYVDVSTDRVGFGTSTPAAELDVDGDLLVRGGEIFFNTSTTAGDYLKYETAKGLTYFENGSEVWRLSSNNLSPSYLAMGGENVGIGTTTPSEKLDVVGNVEVNGTINFDGDVRSIGQSTATDFGVNILGATTNTDGANMALFGKDHLTQAGNLVLTSGGATGVGETIFRRRTDSAFINSMTIDSSGDVSIVGSLSKGSGSFKIDHPLKPETHHLVHSFVESPQADNIYRGTAVLVGGQATVNLDTEGRMTEGTFVTLNGNVQCFTSNEDGWTAVRGSVSGNILTIEAQDNTCTDTVSWMVVGERIDQHMIDASWTDDNGRVITEPLKPETPE